MLFQLPFTAAHKNKPVLRQAGFLKHVLQSHKITEPTERLQSPQIMQRKCTFLGQSALHAQRGYKLLGEKIEKNSFTRK